MTTEWISVKDRLPDLPNWVLVCERAMHIITHWQPLPEPPEDDNDQS